MRQFVKFISNYDSDSSINFYIKQGWIVKSITPNFFNGVFVLFETDKIVEQESDSVVIRGQDVNNRSMYETKQ